MSSMPTNELACLLFVNVLTKFLFSKNLFYPKLIMEILIRSRFHISLAVTLTFLKALFVELYFEKKKHRPLKASIFFFLDLAKTTTNWKTGELRRFQRKNKIWKLKENENEWMPKEQQVYFIIFSIVASFCKKNKKRVMISKNFERAYFTYVRSIIWRLLWTQLFVLEHLI